MGLIRETDVDLIGGRCCEEISLLNDEPEIKALPGPEGVAPLAVYCFEINNINEIWNFCDEERNAIALFRNSLKEIMVSKYSVDNGAVKPVFITDAAELRGAATAFSWGS